jgi:hypothetical protein
VIGPSISTEGMIVAEVLMSSSRSNLSPLIERSGHPSAYYVVIRARFIGERLQFFFLFTYSPEKPQEIVGLFLITYKHFEPFALTI